MAASGATTSPVSLIPMRQLAEAKCSDDNWTGMRDRAERRKRQTRLSLRAHRKRKAVQIHTDLDANYDSPSMSGGKNTGLYRFTIDHGKYPIELPPNVNFIPPGVTQNGHTLPLRYLYPLSRDHLLPLIEFNIWRATNTNILILGHLHYFSASRCQYGYNASFPNPYQSGSLPNSLKPTALQQKTPHPDWIDLFPSPRMRDNAIRSHHRFSHLDLCADLLGGLHEKMNDVESGLRVWSTPWDADGWELTEGFVRKWGFLVEGCTDLFRATNRWRELRGEKRLVWEVE